MPNKTAFVTGGTGFIGLNLVEHLTQSGWDVVALHRPNSRLTELHKYPVRLVEGAIEDGASLDRAVPENVDAVFHVAGDVSLWSGHRERQWRTNVEGTRNMVAAALAKRAKKFVHTSTTSVYGMQPEPFDETAPKLGKDVLNYQRSKTAAEEEVAHGIARRVGRRDAEPSQCHWPLRLEHLVAVHKAGGQPASCFAFRRGAPATPMSMQWCARMSRPSRRDGPARTIFWAGAEASYAEIVQMVGRLLGQSTNTDSRPAGRVAARRPRYGTHLGDHRQGADDYGGIGRDRHGEYRLPQRQGHARVRLSARVDRNHAEGLHRLDGRRKPHRPTDRPRASFAPASPTSLARREMENRLNIRLMTRSYRRGGMIRLIPSAEAERPWQIDIGSSSFDARPDRSQRHH